MNEIEGGEIGAGVVICRPARHRVGTARALKQKKEVSEHESEKPNCGE